MPFQEMNKEKNLFIFIHFSFLQSPRMAVFACVGPDKPTMGERGGLQGTASRPFQDSSEVIRSPTSYGLPRYFMCWTPFASRRTIQG